MLPLGGSVLSSILGSPHILYEFYKWSTHSGGHNEEESYQLYNFSINITPKIHLPKNKSMTIENLQAKTFQHNRLRYSGKKVKLLSHQYSKIKGGGSVNYRNNEQTKLKKC
ncbi:hypothetical protein ACTFIU_000684 [Dictyostelium citrinum]